MALLTWLNGDLFSALRDKTNAAINQINATPLMKVVSIGDWNMDSTTNVMINHGIADYKKIRGVLVIIRDDTDTIYSPLNFSDASGVSDGTFVQATGTQISLNRRIGGVFDSINYDSTSYNRGFITIIYEL